MTGGFGSGPYNVPGTGVARESQQKEVRWAGEAGQSNLFWAAYNILAANVDAGNTPTTVLRAGNVFAQDFSTGGGANAYIYDPDGADGKQIPVGISAEAVNMLDDLGVATLKNNGLYISGKFKEDQLVGLDPNAKSVLMMGRHFLFANHGVDGAPFLTRAKGRKVITAAHTISIADNGLDILVNGSGSVTVTLPTLTAALHGLAFRVTSIANQNLVVTGGSGTILHSGSGTSGAAATTLTWSTSNLKIGAGAQFTAIYAGTALRWLVSDLRQTVTPT